LIVFAALAPKVHPPEIIDEKQNHIWGTGGNANGG